MKKNTDANQEHGADEKPDITAAQEPLVSAAESPELLLFPTMSEAEPQSDDLAAGADLVITSESEPDTSDMDEASESEQGDANIDSAAGLEIEAETQDENAEDTDTADAEQDFTTQFRQQQRQADEQSKLSYNTHKQRIRKAKQRRRKRKAIRILTTLVSTAAVVLLIIYLPWFHVHKYLVNGTVRIDATALVSAIPLNEGDHILKGTGGGLVRILSLRKGAIEDLLKDKFPYIEEIEITPKLPFTVNIDILERQAISYVRSGEQLYFIDKEGKVLDVRPYTEDLMVPYIINAQEITTAPGGIINDDVKTSIRPAMDVLSAFLKNDEQVEDNFKILPLIGKIELLPNSECYLYIRSDYIDAETRIKIANAQGLDAGVSWLRYALRSGHLKGLGKGTLDLTSSRRFFFPDVEVPAP